jgi:sulfur carrier protein
VWRRRGSGLSGRAAEPISTKMNSPAKNIAATSVRLIVSGQPVTSIAGTLAALLIEAGYDDAKVATARNGDFVPERLRATTPLTEGDQIEILSPRQGG